MKKIKERIIFEDTEEMYDYISEENDIYSPTAEMYIFSYNDGGSIAYYTIEKEKAKELAQFAKENDEYWAAALGPGGHIIDAEGRDTTRDTTDIVMFLSDFIHNDWYNTKDYGKVLTENLKLYYVDFECGMNEKRIVKAENFEDALVLALTDGFNKETIVDFYDAIDEVHLYEEEPVSEGAAQYRMVNALTLYGNNEGFRNPRRLEDVILNYDNEDIFIDEEDMETFKTLRENLEKYKKKSRIFCVMFKWLDDSESYCEISAKSFEEALALSIIEVNVSKLASVKVKDLKDEKIYDCYNKIFNALLKVKPENPELSERLKKIIDDIADEIGGDKYRQDWHGWCEEETEAKKAKSQHLYLVKFITGDESISMNVFEWVVKAETYDEALIIFSKKVVEDFNNKVNGNIPPTEVSNAIVYKLSDTSGVQLVCDKFAYSKEDLLEVLKEEDEKLASEFKGKKSFEVTVTLVDRETFTVEASSRDEAEEIAGEMYANGDIIMASDPYRTSLEYEIKEV